MEKLLMWFRLERSHKNSPSFLEIEAVANAHETFDLIIWDDTECKLLTLDALSADERHRLDQKIDSEYRRRTRHLENNIFEHFSEHNREYVKWVSGGSR